MISTGVVSVGEYVELGVEPRRSISLFQVKYSAYKCKTQDAGDGLVEVGVDHSSVETG